ncbi:two-component system chemotaxis response regulator CheB [Pseudomonas sp. BIGb0408]|uniref:protein-glutamate methylesterase n=1 Tax=Phytopseudomonas flavescens TaxID=29435 RepID=A0A7Y9XP59_9GAMM|nr:MULTISPECIES: chemotaxis protein CheB [Pseudomonas]MCW2290460.1 two-component system chemotaxis response regulator CheB [Pseudomonas sp. BIGb0408]NYH74967.1 two-component system chemotaxis response regulator CheB [Pseudomonas flavescens]
MSANPRQLEAVVIGASAGGVEALLMLFEGLPANYGLPLVVVLHLPDSRESLLPALFARRLALRVKEAQDKEALQPGTLYFAAPGYHLCIEADGCFSYSRDEPLHYSRPSIDYLFESAADTYGANVMGILLTGANQDGAAGLNTIKQRGGVTVVQDPQEAQVPTMPEAALALHRPDYILSLRGILALLAELDSRPC